MTSVCCAFKFLRRSVDGKHLMRFQSKIFVLKFLLHNLNHPKPSQQATLCNVYYLKNQIVKRIVYVYHDYTIN